MQAVDQNARMVQIVRILTMIVCPACHAALTMDDACIHCMVCNAHYPIEDGILVLTPQQPEIKSGES